MPYPRNAKPAGSGAFSMDKHRQAWARLGVNAFPGPRPDTATSIAATEAKRAPDAPKEKSK